MSSRDLTLGGYLLFLALGIVLTVLAHRRGSVIPAMSAIFTRIMHRPDRRHRLVGRGLAWRSQNGSPAKRYGSLRPTSVGQTPT
jgi:hypothetical protein